MPAALPAALLALLLHAHLGGLAPLNGKRRPRRGGVFLGVEGDPNPARASSSRQPVQPPRPHLRVRLSPPRQGRCGGFGPEPPLAPLQAVRRLS